MKRILVCSVVAGAVIGVAAHLLKALVRYISLLCTAGFHASSGNYALLWVPVAGIVVTGLMVRYLFRRPLDNATARIKADMAAGRGSLPAVLTVAPVLASSVTLGFGGSAGSEGPIAYTGAAIGSNLGRLFRLSPRQLMLLMTCGAGAGIAAIFKAPVGGMLFTLEVLGMSLTTPSVMMLMTMCMTSSLTCMWLSGYTPDMAFGDASRFATADLLPTLLLGVLCGVYSAYYTGSGRLTRRALERLRRPWTRWLASGAVLGVALYCFPALYGEGYALMAKVAGGRPEAVLDGMAFGSDAGIMAALTGILLLKGIAAYATNSGGGVAGDFAPTLFAGCMAGALFALACSLPVGNYALAGMAGMMAGAIGAPFMAIFLTVEMSATYGLLLPVTLCAVTAHATARLLGVNGC